MYFVLLKQEPLSSDRKFSHWIDQWETQFDKQGSLNLTKFKDQYALLKGMLTLLNGIATLKDILLKNADGNINPSAMGTANLFCTDFCKEFGKF